MCKSSNVLAVFALFCSQAFAQVGIGTTSPHGSAALEISSTNKGFLLPRMTTTERGSIPNPLPGMLIYNTTASKFQGYVGVPSTWISTDPSNTSNSSVNLGPGDETAQTFLAPSTEEINRVSAVAKGSINISPWTVASTTVVAKIYSGIYNSSNPGSPLATSGSVTISSLGTYNFDFNPAFQATSNTTYTLVFTNTDNSNLMAFRQNSSNTYTDGYQFFPPSTTSTSDDLNLIFYTLTGSWVDL